MIRSLAACAFALAVASSVGFVSPATTASGATIVAYASQPPKVQRPTPRPQNPKPPPYRPPPQA